MEENQPGSAQTINDGVIVENQETVRSPDAVLAKNRELVNEKKSMSLKMAEMETKLNDINNAKLLAEGNKDEVITSLRNELKDIKGSSKKKQDQYNWNTVSGHIKQAAIAKGCTNAETLLKLMSSDDLGGIEVYDDFSVNADDLDRALEKAIKDHDDIGLFRRTAKVDDVVPNNNFRAEKKSYNEMSVAELEAELLK